MKIRALLERKDAALIEDDKTETLDRFGELELDEKADGADAGVIKGYASIWAETDNGNDQVMKGAFSNSLKKRPARRIPMLLSHNQQDVPIGVWTVMREDAKGLYVEGKLAIGSEKGRQMYEILKSGADMGLSIGYKTIKRTYFNPTGGDAEPYSNGVIRQLNEVDLREISLVPIPMLDSARITSVKGDNGDEIETKTPTGFEQEAKALIRSIQTATENQRLLNIVRDAKHALRS